MDPIPAQSVKVTIGCSPRHPNHNVNSGLALNIAHHRKPVYLHDSYCCRVHRWRKHGLLSKLAPSSPDYSSRNAEDPAASCIAARDTFMWSELIQLDLVYTCACAAAAMPWSGKLGRHQNCSWTLAQTVQNKRGEFQGIGMPSAHHIGKSLKNQEQIYTHVRGSIALYQYITSRQLLIHLKYFCACDGAMYWQW